MAISESEALAIAEEAARRALAARPVPSCVSLTDAAEILSVSRPTARRMIFAAGIGPNTSGKYRIEDIWRIRGPVLKARSAAR